MPPDTTLAQEIAALSPRMLKQGIDNDEEKGHIAIYNHIHNYIMPKLPTPDRTIPEVHVIAYAVRARLQPTLLLKEMPQLIWGLGHVDFVRRAAVERITELLALDDEFRESGRAGTFTRAERIKIEKTREGLGEDMRRRFREILCGFCLYHVYETWARTEDVDDLLTRYFPLPSLWDDDVSDIEGQYIFHHDLTDAEREELRATVQVYLDLLDRFIADSPPELSPQDFRTQYPPPSQADPRRLTKLTLSYLDQLEKAIQTVTDILSVVGLE